MPEGIIVILMAVAFSSVFVYKIYQRRHPKVDLSNSPILLSYYTEGSNLMPIQKSKIGDMKYFAIGIFAEHADALTGSNALLYRVELPFMTKIHLVGIPKKAGATQIDPAVRGSLMEKVVLEGDYNKYFSLYCEKGMQADARYVLDPAAMEFTIKFSQSNNWEITGNELYFVQAIGTGTKDDPTTMFEDIPSFIKEIRPTIEQPVEQDDAGRVVKKLASKHDYKCPVCQSALTDIANYFSCPNHHGILVYGYKLPLVKSGAISNPTELSENNGEHGLINCPACGTKMDQVPYAGSKTIIDSCSNCPYRWVDSGELVPKAINQAA